MDSSSTTIDTGRLSLDAPKQHAVEVFCVGSHIAGTLHSIRPRVSNHLESADQVIEIADATLETDPQAKPFVTGRTVYINKPKVLFVLDLTPEEWGSGGADLERVSEPRDIFASVGSYWIAGQIELPVGGELGEYLARSPRQFIPVTNADILDYDERTPCTVLVNRDHLEAVVVRPGT